MENIGLQYKVVTSKVVPIILRGNGMLLKTDWTSVAHRAQ